MPHKYEFKVDKIETRFITVIDNDQYAAEWQVRELDSQLNKYPIQRITVCHDLLNVYKIGDSDGIKAGANAGANADETPILFKRLRDGFQIPIRKGAFYDLFNPSTVIMEPGEFNIKIPLGFACKLPAGHFAIVAAKSSTADTYGLQLADGIKIIDNANCGDQNEWILNLIRVGRTDQIVIEAGVRLAQFGIFAVSKDYQWQEVETLNSPNRGGFGSTGK